MIEVKNISFDGRPVEFILNVPYIVLVDPIALKELAVYIMQAELVEPIELFTKLKGYPGLRVGTVEINGFSSGVYQISASDLQLCGYDDVELSKNICEVDSSFIMIMGVDKLEAISKVFTWERFDTALRSPVGDDSKFVEMVNELGGPFFGIIAAIGGTDFQGDGRYKLKDCTPTKVNG